jgi:hypothetical protein
LTVFTFKASLFLVSVRKGVHGSRPGSWPHNRLLHIRRCSFLFSF